LATTPQRAKPRKTATTKAAKAPATRKTAAGKAAMAKGPADPARKTAARKTPASKAAAPRAPRKAANGTAAATKTRTAAGKPPATKASTRRKVARVATPEARLRKLVIDALEDLKARDVQEIDVRGKSSVTDLLVVASGTSSRHVKSIADEVVRKAKQAGTPPIGVEGQREAEWVLVDLGDVIVHVMLPRTREFYGLERLWTVGDEAPEALAG
jgi:ribosome silencing factor RsfS/YbeB/iojap